MPGEVIGDMFGQRVDNGQPPLQLETGCAHCGQVSVVTLPWESARQYIATLEARLAENMRQFPNKPLGAA